MPRAECRTEACNFIIEDPDAAFLLRMLTIHYSKSAVNERLKSGGIVPVHHCTTFTIDGNMTHVWAFSAMQIEELDEGELIYKQALPKPGWLDYFRYGKISNIDRNG